MPSEPQFNIGESRLGVALHLENWPALIFAGTDARG
jgi:hypothetical protein